MTHNQIAYWQLQETRQHNAATRKETERANRANESLKGAQNIETNRHNVVVESIDSFNALENQRSNKAKEFETHRSNVARESETERSNKAKEAETYRSNVARENEAHRSNVAHETEANRHNLAQEGYADREVSIKESLLPTQMLGNVSSATDTFVRSLNSALPLFIVGKSKSNDKNSGSGGSVHTTSVPGSITKNAQLNANLEALRQHGGYTVEEYSVSEQRKQLRNLGLGILAAAGGAALGAGLTKVASGLGGAIGKGVGIILP